MSSPSVRPGILAGLTIVALLGAPVVARGASQQEEQPREQGAEEKPTEPIHSEVEEKIVVSASATGESVRDAPAAVDILDGQDLEQNPGDHLVDQLRRVPGINVVQFSARDVNIASRSSTGGINNSTLALADGRSMYQDFLGFVMWEFAPTDAELIDRVEVVRGPASSLWGANAVGGVVHVITRSPRETLGGMVRAQVGSENARRIEARESFLVGDWALRVSGSFYEVDPFPRPEVITNFKGETIDPDLGLIATDFRDSGTRQPRLDLRADWTDGSDGEWSLLGGWGRTRGWIATGLGPFDVDPSTSMSYIQARYDSGLFETQVYVNYFDGNAKNLINEIPFRFTSGTTNASVRGREILGRRGVVGWGFELNHSDYDLSIAPDGNRRNTAGLFGEVDVALHPKLRLVTGARVDHFRETIGTVFSPRAALRFKPHPDHTLRVAAGRAFRSPSVVETDMRVPTIPVAVLNWAQVDMDNADALGGFPLFSVLAQAVCAPRADNCGAAPGEIPDYVAVTSAVGSRDLEEEVTDSIELGYSARIGRFDVAATIYRTRSEGGIDFPQTASYGFGPDGIAGTGDDIVLPTDPDGDGIDEAPADDICGFNIALDPVPQICQDRGFLGYNHLLSILLDGLVPAEFQWDNGAETENQGFELGLRFSGPANVSLWANYSFQDTPRSDGVKMTDRVDTTIVEDARAIDLDGDGLVADTSEFVNIPAEHRLSIGAQVDRRRWFASASADFVDDTFWQDVLTSDFWGYVSDYTLVGLKAGWRWPAVGLELTGQVTNLLDEKIQQHILGDVIGRRTSVSLGYRWGPDGRPAAARK